MSNPRTFPSSNAGATAPRFATPSSFKPTTARPGENSVNQIPGVFSICGDVRLSPSYKMEDMKEKVHEYLADFRKYVAVCLCFADSTSFTGGRSLSWR